MLERFEKGKREGPITDELLEDFHLQCGTQKGKITRTVYELIIRKHFAKAATILECLHALTDASFASIPTTESKIASLLGYCHYQSGNYAEAARHFEILWSADVTNSEQSTQRGVFFAHCLAKDGHVHEALRIIESISKEPLEAQPDCVAELRLALLIQSHKLSDAKKVYSGQSFENLAENYNYGQYLYRKKRYNDALDVFRVVGSPITPLHSPPTDIEYSEAACMYRQEEYTTTATKAAGIYDEIIRQYPSLAPSYDDRTMIRPEVGCNNATEVGHLAAALVLQAACYLQQGQPRTGRGQLALIPTGLSEKLNDKIDLTYATLDNIIDHPNSIRMLERLEKCSPTVRSAAEHDLLIMYLRHGKYMEAGELVDLEETSVRTTFTEVDWTITEAALIASIDPASAAKVYTQVIEDAVQDIGYYQEELERFRQEEHIPKKSGRIIKKEFQLEPPEKPMRFGILSHEASHCSRVTSLFHNSGAARAIFCTVLTEVSLASSNLMNPKT
ncbi:hypothetical protein BV898_15167 [Hypsibius exemplaris]|uniref:Tetratricopeptide repeat protein 30 n=1 Tax=Hypsibius exemplaris TaxID=2072580 RepID=A0A9X6NA88_HYPEX|nr:hypothetical protein BV898_15167 [Hypsibius exemplaris]